MTGDREVTPADAESVVFDAEPLVAHATDERGCEAVNVWLDAVYDDEVRGVVSTVNLTELRYVLGRLGGEEKADEYLDWLSEIGVSSAPAQQYWRDAADWILEYNPALGDSYALATAHALAETVLLVGGDDDYDDIVSESDRYPEMAIERFRDGSG